MTAKLPPSTGPSDPHRCPHGNIDDPSHPGYEGYCVECAQDDQLADYQLEVDALTEKLEYEHQLKPEKPGLVEPSAEDRVGGEEELHYLLTHQYLAADVVGIGPEYSRSAGLAGMTPLALAKQIADASGYDMVNYSRAGAKSLCVYFANRLHQINSTEGRVFAWHGTGDRTHGGPYSFRIHDTILGPPGSGKTDHLDLMRSELGPALPGLGENRSLILRPTDLTPQGLFGGTLSGNKPSKALGAIRATNGGIVQISEFTTLGIHYRKGGTGDPGVLTEWMSSGDYYSAKLKEGNDPTAYRSSAFLQAASQPDGWSRVAASINNLNRRVFFSRLLPQFPEEEPEKVAEEENLPSEPRGKHPHDPVAVEVLAAKLRRMEAEIQVASFDYSAVERWVERRARDPPDKMVYDRNDLQPVVAISTAYYFLNGAPPKGGVVLPNPEDVPGLLRILEEDARARYWIALDEFDRNLADAAEVLRLGPYMRKPRTLESIQVYLHRVLGIEPTNCRDLIRGRPNRHKDGLIDSVLERTGEKVPTGQRGRPPELWRLRDT